MHSFQTLCSLTLFRRGGFIDLKELCDHCCNDVPLKKKKKNLTFCQCFSVLQTSIIMQGCCKHRRIYFSFCFFHNLYLQKFYAG